MLVVENERFHVHRQILSIHSPVFKAMLSTQFKEAEAKEISLPEKKADEVLNFLKQLYMKDRDEITCEYVSNNVRRTADCLCTLRYPKYIMLNRSSLLCNKRDKNCDKFQLQFSCIVSRLQSFRLL